MTRTPHRALPAGLAFAALAHLAPVASAQAPLVEHAFLKASNADAFDQFGTAVSFDGLTLAVGAPLEASSSAAADDNAVPASGAVYLFRRIGVSWVPLGRVKAPQPTSGDYFGATVALDGTTLVVGAPGDSTQGHQAGAVHVFERVGPTWQHQTHLFASNADVSDHFGVALALDGDRFIVGVPEEDGSATGIGGDGSTNALFDSGAAYVFERSGGAWAQAAYVKPHNTGPGDRFGFAVDISGDAFVVGAPSEDGAVGGIDPPSDNDSLWTGAAYIFTKAEGGWQQSAFVKPQQPQAAASFGQAVALDGDRLAVGAPSESSSATGIGGNPVDISSPASGAVFTFARSDESGWQETAYVKAPNTEASDNFGIKLTLAGEFLYVAAVLEDSKAYGVDGNPHVEGAPNSGAVFMLEDRPGGWMHTHYLKPFLPSGSSLFGAALTASGTTVVVGANQEASLAGGVNQALPHPGTSAVGGVFVFDAPPSGCGATTYGVPSPVNSARLEAPGLGSTLQRLLVRGTEFQPPTGPALLAASAAPSSLPFAGGTLLVDMALVLPGTLVPLYVHDGGFEFSIQPSVTLVGIPVYLQVAKFAPQQPGGLTLSNGLEVTICH